MTQKDREIQRRLRILKHAEETGHVGRTCRYFGIGRASFYRWKAALEKHGEVGLVRKKADPEEPQEPNAARDRRQGTSPAEDLPSGANAHRLVSGALP